MLVSSRSFQAGLYSLDDVRYALNRPLSEDSPQTVGGEVVDSLFEGLDFTRLTDAAGSSVSLASELWRMFLLIMIMALIAEAMLSLPERRSKTSSAAPGTSDAAADFAVAGQSGSAPMRPSL